VPILTIELPVREDQTDFNLRRWTEMTSGTPLGRELARSEGRIETDRHGHSILFRPSDFLRGCFQAELAFRLKDLLPAGEIVIACPISTADGVKAADVAWISRACRPMSGEELCLTQAPGICVEVVSPSNTRAEMAERKALHFAAGADEVWFCDQTGFLTFYCAPNSDGEATSTQCPAFPRQISL